MWVTGKDLGDTKEVLEEVFGTWKKGSFSIGFRDSLRKLFRAHLGHSKGFGGLEF